MIKIGYAHGTQWNDELIEKQIRRVMKTLEINRMPTSVDILKATNNSSLSNAIKRNKGFNEWAKKLGLKQSECETRLGEKGEYFIKELLENKGYTVEKMSVKHPYDLLVNENIKLDIKTANKYIATNNSEYYTFNLEKNNPTCDIYVFVCLGENKKPIKNFVIPSKFLHQTQISIGNSSKYEIYKDRWDYIEQYNKFYSNII